MIALIAAVAAIVVLALAGDDDGGPPAAVAEAYDGTVYVQSNQRGNQNSILAFR